MISNQILFKQTLANARTSFQSGAISKEQWQAYCHHWQTRSARFGLRACQCAECVLAYPASEGYVALGANEPEIVSDELK